MKIHVIKNGTELGIYSRSQIMELIREGECDMNDFGRPEGIKNARPLHEILETNGNRNKREIQTTLSLPQLLLVAKNQHRLLEWSFMALFANVLPLTFIPGYHLYCVLGFFFILNFTVTKLAESLKMNVVFWLFIMMIPFVNLIAAWKLFTHTSQVIREHGFPLRIWGALDDDIKEIEDKIAERCE
jgi:hypothetical protein